MKNNIFLMTTLGAILIGTSSCGDDTAQKDREFYIQSQVAQGLANGGSKSTVTVTTAVTTTATATGTSTLWTSTATSSNSATTTTSTAATDTSSSTDTSVRE